jgi:hypothetical protein
VTQYLEVLTSFKEVTQRLEGRATNGKVFVTKLRIIADQDRPLPSYSGSLTDNGMASSRI